MNSKRKKILFITTPFVVVILLIFWLTGMISLWTEGMSYIANNTNEFSDKKGHIVKGEYSISIDLSNLESNIGKELYKDENHRIYVSWIDPGRVNTGGYIIGFRSSGQYSLTDASLISGIHHATVNESSFTSSMTAKMISEYNGKIYDGSISGMGGLNYKDGDEFSFFIAHTNSNETNENLLNGKGIVDITVTNLYKNIWSNK
jgi:hypothetical protein